MTNYVVQKGVQKSEGYTPRPRTQATVTSKATTKVARIDTTKGSFDGKNPNKVNYVTTERDRPSNGAN